MTEEQVKDLAGLFTDMKAGYARLGEEIAMYGKRLAESKEEQNQFAAKVNQRLSVLQGAKDFGGGGFREPLANVLIQSKGLQERPPASRNMAFHATIGVKDITGVSAGFLAQDRQIAPGPRLDLGVRNLMPETTISGAGGVQVVTETSFTNNAAVVPEGQLKPKSDKEFTVTDLIFRVIAHYFKVSRQCWMDLPELAAVLSDNLVYGLQAKIDRDLLIGNNSSTQLQGIYPLATAATALPAPGTGEPPNTLIDALHAAAAQLAAAGFKPSGGVISAADWGAMQRLKDSTGQYLLTSAAPTLPPLVVSANLTAGQWLIGDFARQSRLYVREEIVLMTSTSNEDDFIKNLICLLAETRLAPAWLNTAAFLKNPGA